MTDPVLHDIVELHDPWEPGVEDLERWLLFGLERLNLARWGLALARPQGVVV